mmetsp:Transcript_3464/g.5934  ORF Transcript_3464/g.5934 Transcript_3464/m.5934 type:complete len:297 (-) Transcript_3464:76-966(-)
MGVVKVAAAAVVAACAAVSAHGKMCEASLPIPALFWTNAKGAMGGVNQYYGLSTAGLSQTEVADEVQKISWADQVSEGLVGSSAAQTDVAVLFIAEELTSDDISKGTNSFLKAYLEGSEGSAVLPMTFSDTAPGVQSAWSTWFFKHLQNVQAEATKVGEELEKAMQQRSEGQPVALMVPLSANVMEWEAQVSATLAAIEKIEATYVAVFTGNKHQSATMVDMEETFQGVVAQRKLQTTTSHLFPVTRIRMTPHGILGLVISLIMVLVILMFLCCIDYVKGPTKFVTRFPALGKISR